MKGPRPTTDFEYETAFSRNLGIISAEEQERLRGSKVALAGLGGVGGIYAHALARLGVGRFTLADGDVFEVANFNRQMGGTMTSVGENKALAVKKQILEVNPQAEVQVLPAFLNEANLDAFLQGADLVVDGMEAFTIPPHRLLFSRSHAHGLPVFAAAPLAFSAAGIVFGPSGMTADDYFDWRDDQDQMEAVANLALGLAPHGLHLKNFDLRHVDVERHVGPSNIGGCLMCAALLVCTATRLLLNRPGMAYAPISLQIDPYSGRLRRAHLRWGNRGPLQRLKKWVLLRRIRQIMNESRTQRLPGMPDRLAPATAHRD